MHQKQATNCSADDCVSEGVKRSEHLVRFYESDEYLVSSVAEFACAALNEDGSAVIIATSGHCEGIKATLDRAGAKVQAALRSGHCVFLDAAATLAQLTDARDRIDPGAFRAVVGRVIETVVARNRQSRVHAFGEMVALLWERGQRETAVELEELWTELGREQDFSLLCAYPLAAFSHGSDHDDFRRVCNCHSRVLPTEQYSDRTAPDRDRVVSELQQRALALQSETVQRRRAEEALTERERELTDFLENAAEGLHQVGPDGTIIWANRAELQMLGYGREEYIGRNVREFHVDQAAITDLLGRLVRGETVHDYPAKIKCRDGSTKVVLIYSNGLFRDGQFCYSRCFSRDVTAQREAAAEQQRLLAEAERVSRMKDEFLATLSHELRTPLNAIFGWTQLLKETPRDAALVAEGIEIIERNVRAQTALIQDLLDMSRIISGHVRLELQRVDLSAVVREAIEAVRLSADARRLQVTASVDPQADSVLGDPVRLQQVFLNLLTNAVKFTPEGGRIEIRLERLNALVEVSVSDNGVGIAPEFLPFVFDRFRQADSSIVRKHGGLGLGLAIVKQLVELQGGAVAAKSPGPGLGSTFIVSLPHGAGVSATTPVARNPEGAASPGRPVMLTGSKILVVEDDQDSRKLIERIFAERGAEVWAAASAMAAMQLLDDRIPDAIVSDIAMPERDGYELMRFIRERFPAGNGCIPAIALTAFARSEDRTRALLAGYQLHMAKPVDPEELVVTVASLMRWRCAQN